MSNTPIKILSAMLIISGLTNLSLSVVSAVKKKEEKLNNERNLIVACIERNENEQEIIKLHKAKINKQINGENLSNGQIFIEYNCSKANEVTNKYRAYENGLPDNSEYDELCKECFQN